MKDIQRNDLQQADTLKYKHGMILLNNTFITF